MNKKINILIFSILGILLLFLIIPVDANCQTLTISKDSTVSKQVLPHSGSEISLVKAVFKTIMALVLVILLVIGFIMGMKWLQNQTRIRGAGFDAFSIVGSLSLGPKKSIYLVRIVERVLVVGVSENNINILTELDAEEAKLFWQHPAKKQNSFAQSLASQISNLRGDKK